MKSRKLTPKEGRDKKKREGEGRGRKGRRGSKGEERGGVGRKRRKKRKELGKKNRNLTWHPTWAVEKTPLDSQTACPGGCT